LPSPLVHVQSEIAHSRLRDLQTVAPVAVLEERAIQNSIGHERRGDRRMNRAEAQARVDSIEWYHDFDFGDGLVARSHHENVDIVRLVWRFIEQQLDRLDFRGKSVLEIGAWDGYWSFYAERRGAAVVVATDDATQNWADGRGLPLARELLESKIEIRQDVSIYDLTTLNRRFDIILCLGVFYHLRDPF